MTQTQSVMRENAVTGQFVELDGIDMYQIHGFDEMAPFLMSIVSDSDHWMYVSTRGGLAAGRVEPERSLFPYETDDRLYRADGNPSMLHPMWLKIVLLSLNEISRVPSLSDPGRCHTGITL